MVVKGESLQHKKIKNIFQLLKFQKTVLQIQAFMGFKPMTLITKCFPASKISKENAFKIQALMGFKPMTKYFTASEISEKKAYETIKHRPNGFSKEKAYNILAFMGFKPMTFLTKYLFHLTKYQKRNPSKLRSLKQNIFQLMECQKKAF